jgi:hypothetical protein
VHVVEADEALSRQLADQWDGHALVVITFDEFEEVDAQDLKDHDEVLAIRAVVDE